MRMSTLSLGSCLILMNFGTFGCTNTATDDAPITSPADSRTGKSDGNASDQPDDSDPSLTFGNEESSQFEPTDAFASANGTDAGLLDAEERDSSAEETGLSESAQGEESTCARYESNVMDYAPLQTTGDMLPNSVYTLDWQTPTIATNLAPFSGTAGQSANHEGIDYIHGDATVSQVWIFSAAEGEVVYVRSGCPQTTLFEPNGEGRECGSGWGNHVIVKHTETVYTRYAHLAPGTIGLSVGDSVSLGDTVGEMGNSGRSELRHLHFELGVRNQPFNACGLSQSFLRVFNPSILGL